MMTGVPSSYQSRHLNPRYDVFPTLTKHIFEAKPRSIPKQNHADSVPKLHQTLTTGLPHCETDLQCFSKGLMNVFLLISTSENRGATFQQN